MYIIVNIVHKGDNKGNNNNGKAVEYIKHIVVGCTTLGAI